MFHPVAIFAALSLCATAVLAVDVTGIVAPEQLNTTQPASSGSTCSVVLQPFTIYSPTFNSTLPTASPVPPYVLASLSFAVYNQGSEAISAPWNLQLSSSHYQAVLQVTNVDLQNFTGGSITVTDSTATDVLGAKSNTSVTFGVVLQGNDSALVPEMVMLNGNTCTVTLANNITSPFTPFKGGAAVEAAEQPLSIQNGQYIGVDGNPLTLRCANYFGFDNGQTMFDGLWAGGSALTQDFETVLHRNLLLGFNCFRVPFSFQNLFNLQASSFTKACNAVSNDDIRASVTPPGVTVPASASLPGLKFSVSTNPSTCNEGLPNDSVYHRFLFLLQILARNNMYIIIDNHSQDPTVKTSPTQWVSYYKQLMTDIAADTPSVNRVIVDVLNEPDHTGYGWDKVGPLYLAAMDAMHEVSPDTTYLVEGCGQLGFPGMNWGDGFVTDGALIQQYGLSDPRGTFFDPLRSKPYLNNVGISPHVYPPSVTFQGTNYVGSGLWYRMYTSFGYLNTVGYASHVFPIVMGETGSFFATATDIQSMADIAAYARADKDTGVPHTPLQGICFWSWNANSGDTGGLVDSNQWTAIQWTKLNWLIGAIGLQPWVACSVGVSIGNPIASTAGSVAVLNLAVSNTGTTNVPVPWTLTMSNPAYVVVQQAWNWATSNTIAAGGLITGTASLDWQSLQASAANQVGIGAVVRNNASDITGFIPQSITLNGVSCSVVLTSTPAAVPPPPSPQASSPSPFPSPSPSPVPQASPPPPKVNSPPPRVNSPPPKVNSPPPKVGSPPPKVSSPPPKATPSTSPAAKSPPPAAPPANTSSPKATCLVTSTSQGSWSLGSNNYGDSIQLYVQNTGSKAIPVPWTLAIGNHYTGVSGSVWNWDLKGAVKNGTITGVASQGWQALSADSGNSVNVGGVLEATSSSLKPTVATLNGAACIVK